MSSDSCQNHRSSQKCVRITGPAHNMCQNKCAVHNYAGIVAPTPQPVKSTAPVTTWSKSLAAVLRPMSYLLLQPQVCHNHRSSSQVGRIHRSTSEVCQKDNQAHNTPSERCRIHRSKIRVTNPTDYQKLAFSRLLISTLVVRTGPVIPTPLHNIYI